MSFDPARPAEALPTGIVAKRMAAGPVWPAMLLGFGVGLYVWFKGMAFMPLLSGMASAGRWILSALPLLTLPWWMDGLPHALAALTEMITVQVRALDDAKRAALFANLQRDKHTDLKKTGSVFLPASKEAADDPAASAATRRTASRLSLRSGARGEIGAGPARSR